MAPAIEQTCSWQRMYQNFEVMGILLICFVPRIQSSIQVSSCLSPKIWLIICLGGDQNTKGCGICQNSANLSPKLLWSDLLSEVSIPITACCHGRCGIKNQSLALSAIAWLTPNSLGVAPWFGDSYFYFFLFLLNSVFPILSSRLTREKYPENICFFQMGRCSLYLSSTAEDFNS